MGSTATADKKRLDTGTLGWSDIDNRADFKTEHQCVGFSSGSSIGSQFAGNMANGLLTGGNNEGHGSTTTHAAISDGGIIVRDKDKQQQDVANLSRDVEHANQILSPILNRLFPPCSCPGYLLIFTTEPFKDISRNSDDFLAKRGAF
ncbi:hypothetical protein WD218_005091 [Klebsiella variicola]